MFVHERKASFKSYHIQINPHMSRDEPQGPHNNGFLI